MLETFEQYNLKLLALGKNILDGLDDVEVHFLNWIEELNCILSEGEKALGVFFAKDAFEILGFSDEEKLLAVTLFYVEKSTGRPMLTRLAFRILSVHLLKKYRKILAPSFIVNGDYIHLSEVLSAYLEGDVPQLPSGMQLKLKPVTDKESHFSIQDEEIKEQAENFFTNVSNGSIFADNPIALVIDGEKNSGRHQFLEQVAFEKDMPILWLAVTETTYTTGELNAFVECALLYGGFVCISLEYDDWSIMKWLSGWFGVIGIVTDSSKYTLNQDAYGQFTIQMPSISDKKEGPINLNILKTNMTFDDLKLPTIQHKQLMDLCDMIAVRKDVLTEWGFLDKFSYGNGMSILFYGAPGTGKTMAAGVMANALQLPLYRVDLSQLISKYIGETQKNIGKIFDEAEKRECILLFDEADAIFSKRSDVSDAQDRYSNAETAYLLQRIEQYNGVSILATNLLQNFDEAFRRRISYMVHFPLPDEALREKMWQDIFPKDAKLSEDFDALALAQAFELSGAAIKSAALHSAYMAMADNAPIGMKHILTAIFNEYSKTGKNLSKAQNELFNAYNN